MEFPAQQMISFTSDPPASTALVEKGSRFPLLPGQAGFGALCLHVHGVWTVICMSEEAEWQEWMENSWLCSKLGIETIEASIDLLVLSCPSLPSPTPFFFLSFSLYLH